MTIIWYMVLEIWSVMDRIFLFWTTFYPFTPLTIWKIKTFKKWKKTHGDIIVLNKCTKNHDHMLHCSWDTMRDGCNSYFLFWVIFCPFTPPRTFFYINFRLKNMKQIIYQKLQFIIPELYCNFQCKIMKIQFVLALFLVAIFKVQMQYQKQN